jgi:adenylate cyclase, class 2
MQTEFEVKVLDINPAQIQEKLTTLGALFHGRHMMRRYVYDFNPPMPDAWVRLRDNGISTTITIKEITASTIDGTKELELVVDSFDVAHAMLKRL